MSICVFLTKTDKNSNLRLDLSSSGGLFMFTLSNLRIPYVPGIRENILRYMSFPFMFFATFAQSFASRRTVKDRRKGARRETDYASHQPYQYIYCARDENGNPDPQKSKFGVVIDHGLRGYADLYSGYAEYFSYNKIANSIILDLPGHGKRAGERCEIKHPRDVERCIASGVLKMYSLNPRAPIIIIAFSMSGLFTILYYVHSAPDRIKRHIAGIICLGVPLNVGEKVSFSEALKSMTSCAFTALKNFFSDNQAKSGDVPAWKIYFAPYIARMLPRWKINELCMDQENISHDPAVTREIWNNPLIFKKQLRARTAHFILQAANATFDLLREGGHERLGVPVLFLRGELDPIGALGPYEKGNIPIKSYPGFKHELLKGSGSEIVRQDIDEWIETVALPQWHKKQKRSKNDKGSA